MVKNLTNTCCTAIVAAWLMASSVTASAQQGDKLTFGDDIIGRLKDSQKLYHVILDDIIKPKNTDEVGREVDRLLDQLDEEINMNARSFAGRLMVERCGFFSEEDRYFLDREMSAIGIDRAIRDAFLQLVDADLVKYNLFRAQEGYKAILTLVKDPASQWHHLDIRTSNVDQLEAVYIERLGPEGDKLVSGVYANIKNAVKIYTLRLRAPNHDVFLFQLDPANSECTSGMFTCGINAKGVDPAIKVVGIHPDIMAKFYQFFLWGKAGLEFDRAPASALDPDAPVTRRSVMHPAHSAS